LLIFARESQRPLRILSRSRAAGAGSSSRVREVAIVDRMASAASPFIERQPGDTDAIHLAKRQVATNQMIAGCIGERAKPKRQKLGPGPGENGSYAVEGIIDSKLFPASLHSRVPRVTKYRVRFVGWGPMHDEWMLEDDLEDAQELLTDYKHREEVRVLQNKTLGLYSQLGAIS
jgi:hypothetical protein